MKIEPQNISQAALHGYLLSAVAPRPICFASTIDRKGRVNLSPFSYFNVFSSNPPIMIFSPALRGRDGSTKDSLDNVKEVPEVTINMVNHAIVEQMSLASTEYEKGVNEFIKSGLTAIDSEKVQPPRVGESPVSFECRVNDIVPLGDEGGAGNLIICQMLLMHIKDDVLKANGRIDTQRLDLVARMGENWYCRAQPEALFEIPKPLKSRGIGVDQLPAHVQNSEILSGNDLGRLGNMETLPTSEEIAQLQENPELSGVLTASLEKRHQLAKTWLGEGKTREALALLHL
jgi:flavin reductase (DIM6/NTAB) family NADH-FMN oxidoreductase RutF